MDVKEVIHRRRAYRSLNPVKITEDLIEDLAECAQLAASCFNNQPWRFVFVHDPQVLREMHGALSKGNEWIHYASMIVVVFTKKDLDCVVKGREYYLFDAGMATAQMILRATELGMVAHPIAGFHEDKVKEILGIPKDMTVITLVNFGKKRDQLRPVLSQKQREWERERPERLPLEKFVHINSYGGE
ncbi:MAG: nitroreductase [candidate division Zixibacteria bacterium SM23_81]|nr:MAG: nitroreductase [candidate division Zixibacteria bacterium SM23_81]